MYSNKNTGQRGVQMRGVGGKFGHASDEDFYKVHYKNSFGINSDYCLYKAGHHTVRN